MMLAPGRRSLAIAFALACVTAAAPVYCAAAEQETATDIFDDGVPDFELGEEYSGHSKGGASSGTVRERRSSSGSRSRTGTNAVLMYIPNRLLDLLDIIRLDVGIGPAIGGVIRATKFGQFGYRQLSPASLRLGLRGRRVPFFVEASNEFGFGPAFIQSPKRSVGAFELGAGADLGLGAYGGVDFAELADFLTGIAGFDIKDDDL